MKRDKVDILMDVLTLALLAGLLWALAGLVVWVIYHWGHDHSGMVGGMVFGLGALRAKLEDLKETVGEEMRRLRKNEEVVLWHITPSEDAMASILEGLRAAPSRGHSGQPCATGPQVGDGAAG